MSLLVLWILIHVMPGPIMALQYIEFKLKNCCPKIGKNFIAAKIYTFQDIHEGFLQLQEKPPAPSEKEHLSVKIINISNSFLFAASLTFPYPDPLTQLNPNPCNEVCVF
jgi:hypothetical protein